MAYKENMTQAEYDADLAELVGKAKEGLFAEEDVTKRVQSESDKVRQELYKTKIKPMEDELVKLKPKDKTTEELEFEKRQTELATKEKEIASKEKFLTIQSKLQENKLPSALAKYIHADDVDTTVKEVNEIINQFILDGSYKPTKHKSNDGITFDEFKKMNYSQRSDLAEKNPELYAKLSKM